MPLPVNPHILGSFEQALVALRAQVLMMASLTAHSLENAEKALFRRDDRCSEACILADEEIDTLEIQIDRSGMEFLLRFQPVATDMRQVLSAMKMSINIERIADHIVSIARIARSLNAKVPLGELDKLTPLFRVAKEMFRDSVKAYADGDAILARAMKGRDRELDQMNRSVIDFFTDRMGEAPSSVRGYLKLIFISQNLERMGDHATNLCEDVIYICAAEDIRHIG